MDAWRQGHLPVSIPLGQQELRLCSGMLQNLPSVIRKISRQDDCSLILIRCTAIMCQVLLRLNVTFVCANCWRCLNSGGMT